MVLSTSNQYSIRDKESQWGPETRPESDKLPDQKNMVIEEILSNHIVWSDCSFIVNKNYLTGEKYKDFHVGRVLVLVLVGPCDKDDIFMKSFWFIIPSDVTEHKYQASSQQPADIVCVSSPS